MAKKPFRPAPPDQAEKSELCKDALKRLTDARAQKDMSVADIEECYYFAAPRRLRSQSSNTNNKSAPGDESQLMTSLGYEVAEDFMTMLIDSFMPQSGRWAERRLDPFLRKAVRDRLEKQVREQDEQLFDCVRGSNFHAELAKQGVPDGAIGVLAMLVDDPGKGKPYQCSGVPIRELEMNLGPDGRIDDRFVVRYKRYRDLAALLPEVSKDTYSKEVQRKIKDSPDEEIEVVWGWWKLWDKAPNEAWQHIVLVGEEEVHKATLEGAGSCALVIGRFGATPDFAWPDGPLIKALPELVVIDETDAAFVENLDFTLRPPFAYDDDGILNFEDGVDSGKAYPRRPGAGRNSTIEKIWEPNPIDAAMFQHDARQRRVRRLHYVDFPDQPGKTPPTATQWLDEMVEAQKKIGTPGYAFWHEFPFDAFQRFRYLAERRGAIKPIELDGVPVSLQAYNPAQRAQENQEVLQASRLLQIVGAAFPQMSQVAIDSIASIKNIQAKLGDKLIVITEPEQLAQSVEQVASLAGVGGAKLPGGLTGGGGGGA